MKEALISLAVKMSGCVMYIAAARLNGLCIASMHQDIYNIIAFTDIISVYAYIINNFA